MEMHIVIKGDKDLRGQLYQQMRDAIRSGRLAAGSRIPPSRLLAEQLGISRKTVSTVYAKLTDERLLTGQVGVGTFVNSQVLPRAQSRGKGALAGAAVVKRWNDIPTPLRHPELAGRSRYEYIGGSSTKNQFPMDEWRRCVLFALRQDAESRGLYQQAEGVAMLRDAIARHIGFARGVACTASDIIVTNGAQQALDLIARVLVEPGCVVAVEDPGYPPARLLFASQGANVCGVPVDSEGMVVDRIPENARLIYVTPSHQFPLGMPMSMQRRQALLDKAREIGAIIIEDDYDSEFRFEGRPADSLQGMDQDGIVAYVGTFSKVLLPELRLGYVVAPAEILNAIAVAKHLTDWHTTSMTQYAIAKFIDDGYLARHIRQCHAMYARRREKLLARFSTDLAEWFEVIPSVAGFHLAALCKRKLDIPLLIKLARQVGVGLYPLDGFYHFSEPRQGLMLGFGSIEALDIDFSLDLVRNILQQMGD
ncbi:PLP-dependent aminotransferase family protein [Undibacterium sp.]|jgi:GntR family transcriptional regulator/MocR family aminotransferase|uniref:MocR-like pyridoxine biosynthesis transcription factor PdxR n=1 Tax=Undibacterium sp. TaxID=1914977 RepID=UPI002BF25955|nr:PLP-dependent aminotransferase family protein [Undibacterium sp.]HTD05892.1 PLP-dependent aminotransferase family protein [Undibacterium sp.]